MTVGNHLSSLSSSLILSDDEKTKINTSIETLSSRIDNYFGSIVNDHIQFGSSTRGTILPRKVDERSDIDYMIVFDTSNGTYKPQTYLNKLKSFAEEKYSTSVIKPSYPTIVLELQHIKFELVPAITDGFGYKIPSPSSSWTEWMDTYPNDFNQKLTTANTNNNSQIRPLVRLMKYWNVRNSHIFNSYGLEKHIIECYFPGCRVLKDYFYYYWALLSINTESQSSKDKLQKGKDTVTKIKRLEDENKLTEAEDELKKFLPSI